MAQFLNPEGSHDSRVYDLGENQDTGIYFRPVEIRNMYSCVYN